MKLKASSDYDIAHKEERQAGNDIVAVDVVEISGIIKWFDSAKGYGFVVPDDGSPDVLLHVTCLRRDGYRATAAGSKIILEALRRPSGLQALRVLSLEVPETQAQRLKPSEAHFIVQSSSGFEQLTVKWFNRVKGYGFLTRDDTKTHAMADDDRSDASNTGDTGNTGNTGDTGNAECPDIFIHMETLRYYGLSELYAGQQIMARYGRGPNGLIVTEVQIAAKDNEN